MLAEIFWDRIEITASFSVFIRSQADRPQESPCVAGEWNGRQCQQVQSNTCPGKNDFPDLIASLKLGVTSKVTHGRYSDSSLRMQGQHEKGIQMYGSITERTGKKLKMLQHSTSWGLCGTAAFHCLTTNWTGNDKGKGKKGEYRKLVWVILRSQRFFNQDQQWWRMGSFKEVHKARKKVTLKTKKELLVVEDRV